MDLYLRKSDQGQLGPEIYRVILKDEDGDEVEIGSISVQHSAGAEYYWKWAIDTVIQSGVPYYSNWCSPSPLPLEGERRTANLAPGPSGAFCIRRSDCRRGQFKHHKIFAKAYGPAGANAVLAREVGRSISEDYRPATAPVRCLNWKTTRVCI